MSKPTPQSWMRRYLILELYEAGGKASLSDMKRALSKHLWEGKEVADMKERTTGEETWWNNVRWERNRLKNEGYIRKYSERGIWELSEKGVERAEEYIANPPPTLDDF